MSSVSEDDSDRENKPSLSLEDFEIALEALDEELNSSRFIIAFAPIKLICAGEFLALKHLKSRNSACEIEYLMEHQWAKDKDITTPMNDSLDIIAAKLGHVEGWMEEDLGIFVTRSARVFLLETALKQQIVLFNGRNFTLLGAPMEWALECKMRRIYMAPTFDKDGPDVIDALAIMDWLQKKNGKQLEREFIRTLNLNTFDVVPDNETMDLLAEAYRERYGGEIFRPGSHVPSESYSDSIYHRGNSYGAVTSYHMNQLRRKLTAG